jgi:hypothetical protein
VHSTFLKSLIAENPAHPLGQIPSIFNDVDLLAKLQEAVTMESKTMRPTGVPPHVDHAVKLRKALDMLEGTSIERMRNQTAALVAAVQDAICLNDL